MNRYDEYESMTAAPAEKSEPVDFEDMHHLPAEGACRPTPEGPTVTYDEDCPKCRGSGSYGRVTKLGHSRCTKCKGTGKLTFKTSPEYRAKGRAASKRRKLKKIEADRVAGEKRWAAYLADHEAIAEWLVAADARGFNYATDLTAKGLKWGHLTEGQEIAVYKCIARDEDHAEAQKNPAATVNLDAVLAAFGNAFESGLKKPMLHIGRLVFSRAPDTGANPGFLYVKAEGEYAGKIDPDGGFLKSYKCTDADVQDIAELAKAVEHGRRSGRCACCNRKLTAAISVERGIGPICAERWGIG